MSTFYHLYYNSVQSIHFHLNNTTFFSGALESHSSMCITQLKDRILKMAMDKQPQLLQMVDNHEIKGIVQQVVAGADISLTESQIQAINDWMDNLAENTSAERKRFVYGFV